jgi:hypothetical protein
LKVIYHFGDAVPAVVVVEDESGSLALVFFYFGDVFLGVRVPNCTTVFEMWTDKRKICLLP